MKYAWPRDVSERLQRTFTTSEEAQCAALLEDAGTIIDAIAQKASIDAKALVSIRMVLRIMSSEDNAAYPPGTAQGSQTALGYTQQWTMPSGGSFGELYLSKADRRLLGLGDAIGSRSPLEDMTGRCCAHDPRNDCHPV